MSAFADKQDDAAIRSCCEEHGFLLSREYIAYLRALKTDSFDGSSATTEAVLHFLLATDLRSTTEEGEGEAAVERHNFERYFPSDINLRCESAVTLPVSTTPVVLQITTATTNIANTNKHRFEDKHGDTPRCLSLVLTDGHMKVTGIETSPIESIKANTPPGTKVQYFGGEVVDGKLLLTSKNCRLLGGAVPHLLRGWQANNSVQRPRPQGGDGPPLFDFNLSVDAEASDAGDQLSVGGSVGAALSEGCVDGPCDDGKGYVSIFSNPAGGGGASRSRSYGSSSSSGGSSSAAEEGGGRRPKVNAGAAKRMVANQLGIRLQRPQKPPQELPGPPAQLIATARVPIEKGDARGRGRVDHRDQRDQRIATSSTARGARGGRDRGGFEGSRRDEVDSSLMDGMIASLLDMGYSDKEAVAAVRATGGEGLHAAVDWMLDGAPRAAHTPSVGEEDFPLL